MRGGIFVSNTLYLWTKKVENTFDLVKKKEAMSSASINSPTSRSLHTGTFVVSYTTSFGSNVLASQYPQVFFRNEQGESALVITLEKEYISGNFVFNPLNASLAVGSNGVRTVSANVLYPGTYSVSVVVDYGGGHLVDAAISDVVLAMETFTWAPGSALSYPTTFQALGSSTLQYTVKSGTLATYSFKTSGTSTTVASVSFAGAPYRRDDIVLADLSTSPNAQFFTNPTGLQSGSFYDVDFTYVTDAGFEDQTLKGPPLTIGYATNGSVAQPQSDQLYVSQLPYAYDISSSISATSVDIIFSPGEFKLVVTATSRSGVIDVDNLSASTGYISSTSSTVPNNTYTMRFEASDGSSNYLLYSVPNVVLNRTPCRVSLAAESPFVQGKIPFRAVFTAPQLNDEIVLEVVDTKNNVVLRGNLFFTKSTTVTETIDFFGDMSSWLAVSQITALSGRGVFTIKVTGTTVTGVQYSATSPSFQLYQGGVVDVVSPLEGQLYVDVVPLVFATANDESVEVTVSRGTKVLYGPQEVKSGTKLTEKELINSTGGQLSFVFGVNGDAEKSTVINDISYALLFDESEVVSKDYEVATWTLFTALVILIGLFFMTFFKIFNIDSVKNKNDS